MCKPTLPSRAPSLAAPCQPPSPGCAGRGGGADAQTRPKRPPARPPYCFSEGGDRSWSPVGVPFTGIKGAGAGEGGSASTHTGSPGAGAVRSLKDDFASGPRRVGAHGGLWAEARSFCSGNAGCKAQRLSGSAQTCSPRPANFVGRCGLGAGFPRLLYGSIKSNLAKTDLAVCLATAPRGGAPPNPPSKQGLLLHPIRVAWAGSPSRPGEGTGGGGGVRMGVCGGGGLMQSR